MKTRAPITDVIDVRNFNDELKRSIVKRSRVRFIMDGDQVENNDVIQEVAEPELDLSSVDPDVLATADEIFQRLQREAEADERAKEAEWIAKIAQENGTEEMDESLYNKTTGSYSGSYGKGDVSDETKEMAASILGKKDDDFANLILNSSDISE